jgi:uncharacterized protein (DUF1697 family)
MIQSSALAYFGLPMASHIAFLRAVNVAGHAVVPMAEVVKVFAKGGCGGVKSYGHAGNLLWAQAGGATPMVKVRTLLTKLLGHEPGIMVRTKREMQAIIAGDPFGARTADKALKCYVVFLAKKPAAVPPLPLRQERECVELIAVRGADAYVVAWRKPSGMSGFPNQFVEKTLGVAATSRNWSTVTKTAALLEQALEQA